MTDSFVHLHTHSEYSLLDGLGRVKKLVNEVKRLGQPALALTDHGNMHGAVEFFRACKGAEIKPIIGLEAYQTAWGRPMGGREAQFDKENYHLLLLAKNMTGYRNLLKISSQSQINGYYYKPRVDHEFLANHAEGLVATTGCLGAEVPQLINQGREREAYQQLGWYLDVFGRDNFFIELQEHSIPELVEVNKTLVPWAKRFDIPLVATNDVHYVQEADSTPHDVLICVQTGAVVKAEKRMRLSDGSYFLKSRAQMESTFQPLIDLPSSAFDNSVHIAEMCEVDLEDSTYHFPDIEIPDGYTYESYLRKRTEEGLERLYGEQRFNDDVQERKERELRIIKEMGFDVYFLIVADMCDFAKEKNIWWNVRGSGAGSLVAYCIGVTGIDPLKNNLIFERFLNPGRVTMPDFDLDYPDDQREDMIRYTIDKYGADQVAQIATFGRMKARAAIRDVGRAKDIALSEVDRVAKMIPAIPGKPVTINDVLTEGHEFYNPELVELVKKEQWVQDLLETSMQVEGVARHAGIHAAAVIVSDRDITHYTPLMRPSKGSVAGAVTQYEFPILESIGLLKVDFLGLSTLTIMREAGQLIKERHGIEFTLDNIPFEGEEAEEAFTLLSSGDVSGVFQVEGQGMRRVLTEMKPSMFEHIIATISLYRPGPLEYIPQFIRRMHGEEEVEFKHPKLESILGETYGICVYQEQIIQILSQLAGYTPGDADLVRRAIGKKKASEIERHKQIFIDGCSKNGIPKSASSAIYADIEFFARYGFNKCLPGDVEVVDAQTGRLVKIEDLYTGKVQLEETITCNIDNLTLQAGAVSAVMDNGIKPVYRLTTALGRTIEATANHPFYTFDSWRLLEELAIGDQIATPRAVPVEGKNEWPKHEVIALGHLLAEGNLCHPHSVYYYSQDSDQCDDYVRAAEAFDNVECTISIHKETYSIYAKRVDRAQPPGIVSWAKELGIWGKKATEKEIPDDLFTLRNDQIGLLISRMWEGDGHINSSDRSLFYATSSERMARQLQHLLLRLGIISRLRTVTFAYKEGRIGYQLYITGNDNIANFRQAIALHFISHERKARMDELVLQNPAHSTVKDVIPLPIKEVVRTAKERNNITWKEMNEACGVAPREFYPTGAKTKSGFTRQTIQRLADYFDDDILSKYAQSDIYWDRIIQIDYIGEKRTYDLEIPNTHNFVANDIIVHNSHAADYAVITVQTAYLKAHYPVDYMAALLLVERDKTEKVVNFINECRRMGIDVLEPDVNYSGLDFEIQELPADTPSNAKRDPHIAYNFPVPEGSAIRFGMAAVKNVGEGPVQVILDARKAGGPFKSLTDFCDRVDLRQVNKRSLECLFKVGAFDRFGKRSQLIAVMEQMIGQSASVHSARADGQLSMFDLLGATSAAEVAPIQLPNIEEAKGRERLEWEKELLGVYTKSHPMQNLPLDMQKIVTCSSAQLDEAYNGKNLVMAGMVHDVRTITTKKGDMMAFMHLEDLTGRCEVVVFPRTYADFKDLLVQDNVILIKGKGQTREGQTNLLADTIQTYVEQRKGSDDEEDSPKKVIEVAPTINGTIAKEREGAANPEAALHSTPTMTQSKTIAHEAAINYPNVGPGYSDHEPPPIEESPFANDRPGWMASDEAAPPPNQRAKQPLKEAEVPYELTAPSPEIEKNGHHRGTGSAGGTGGTGGTDSESSKKVKMAQSEEVEPEAIQPNAPILTPESMGNGNDPSMSQPPISLQHTPLQDENSANGQVNGNGQNGHDNGYTNGHSVDVQVAVNEEKNQENASSNGEIVANPMPKEEVKHRPILREDSRSLHIKFRRSGNLDRDKYRLKEIYDCVRNPRGRDRFFIILESNGISHQLAFPNDLCAVDDTMMQELQRHFRVDVSLETVQ